jgi:oligosaccharide reducing-end xylanase
MKRTRSPAWCAGLASALAMLASCNSSLDSLGCTERKLDGGTPDGGAKLGPLLGPASYPNAFRDLLGKSDSEITAKVADVYGKLFHGDAATESIFVTTGTDKAYVLDVLHNEIRTEGIGLGMLIAVALDKRDDHDRLWRYAKSIQVAGGPAQGYFPSYCNADNNGTAACYDPFGLQQITMALLLARGRWQNAPGDIDYGQEAANLLDVIRNKEAFNCGVVGDITSTFDSESKLPHDTPTTASANLSRPSIAMPAYYELWQQATGDPFWGQAAAAARAYWQAAADPSTGLVPERASFDGKGVPGFDTFMPECDRTFFNMALDRIWSGTHASVVDQSNHVLQFFYGQGVATYGQSYELDGTELTTLHDMPLVAANGALALAATMSNRRDFVDEVWNLDTPIASARYYAGLMRLFALVMLSGQMRVY